MDNDKFSIIRTRLSVCGHVLVRADCLRLLQQNDRFNLSTSDG